ncbi:hypothetical protein D1872_278420 [compost metagenome]
MNCGKDDFDFSRVTRQTVYSQRHGRNLNNWDRERYNRIVGIIEGVVDFVLSDDERLIIQKKYLDRNTMSLKEIATSLHRDRTTVGRWHREAIGKFADAMMFVSEDDWEITPFDHMFDKDIIFREPA